MANMTETLNHLAMALVLVGALNWGLVGVLDFNLVSALLGAGMMAKAVYTLVGVSAVYVGFTTYFKK